MGELPTPRDSVRGIPAYVAGKPSAPRPGLTAYKVSANENPFPPLPAVLDAAARAAREMNRYPDMGCHALYDALAEHLGVPENMLAAGTGSVALIYQLLQAYCEPGDEVVYAWRSFEAYPIAAAASGVASVRVPVTADGRHDLTAMAAAVGERTRAVLVCTPNNPTGPALTHTELAAFVEALPSRVLVVVDEAYREFVRSPDPVDGVALATAHANLALLRTFSKAHGLAGLRVGYAIAAEPIATTLRAVTLPFGVNGIAQAAAVESLRHTEELLARVDELVTRREALVADLASVGWPVPEPQGNFVWFELGERTLDFAAAADEVGLSVRPFAGEGCRATVAEPEANARLVELAATFAPAR